jgi:transcriptional regulator with XRE-family HTH domain
MGVRLKQIRETMNPPLSQRKLAEKMQVLGLDIDRHVIRRIENGERFVTDIELKMFSNALNVSYKDLLD